MTPHDDQHDVYQALHTARTQGRPVALATIVSVSGSVPRHAGAKMLIDVHGATVGTVGGGAMESGVVQTALETLTTRQPQLKNYTLNDIQAGDAGICGGTLQIFIEPILNAPLLLVIGGGHVGKALAELGAWLGWRVALSDDRPEYCNPSIVPNLAGYLVCAPHEIISHAAQAALTIDAQTYIAAVTRGLPVDLALLPALLQTPAAYIGLIGSRRRWALTQQALRDQYQLSQAELSRIYAPIGLELNAETPQEIALSIFAQITQLRRGGDGQPMRWMENDENPLCQ